ncbi:MAG: 30S ribosomal protein S15 [Acholeplasmatales bacterium]|jgi:ribosomal protein S15|nr:30S ribosomal protein S15 [Acholeplasmatales bacterium]
MALSKELKAQLVQEFGKNAKDTGSTAVQIAILTKEIDQLNAHLAKNIHDFHSSRSLLIKVGQRRSLINYLKNNDVESYEAVANKLGFRR